MSLLGQMRSNLETFEQKQTYVTYFVNKKNSHDSKRGSFWFRYEYVQSSEPPNVI